MLHFGSSACVSLKQISKIFALPWQKVECYRALNPFSAETKVQPDRLLDQCVLSAPQSRKHPEFTMLHVCVYISDNQQNIEGKCVHYQLTSRQAYNRIKTSHGAHRGLNININCLGKG